MEDRESILREFILECHEMLEQLDHHLMALEKDPGARESIGAIFRAMHTIKGNCGFFGFGRLESVSHAAESLLGGVREGQMTVTPAIIQALFASVDAVRNILGEIEAGGAEGGTDVSSLLARLGELKSRPDSPAAPAAPEPAPPPSPKPMPGRLGDLLVDMDIVRPDQIEQAIRLQKEGDPRLLGEILIERGLLKPEDVENLLHMQAAGGVSGIAKSHVRIDVKLLDRMMNLVGELVLGRNRLVQHAASLPDRSLSTVAQGLDRVTTELQEEVMKTRMQPILHVWDKFRRLVRDLSASLQKKVRLEFQGGETELDRGIIDAVRDPLMHLIRNALDHGLETPEKRRARGKPEEGLLLLRAFHEAGMVILEVTDDGTGIDSARIRKKAVERGILRGEQVESLSERDAVNLIFLPGFSTADQVTVLSGRGVGTDVVKSAIERIGGVVEVETTPGKGTTFRMRIPLTLAIIQALIVVAGKERLAIPQANLVELFQLEKEAEGPSLEDLHGTPVYRLRGRLLPMIDLRRELRLDPPGAGGGPSADGVRHIVVLQANKRQFGLIVDRVLDTYEIVVKPLDRQLRELGLYAGATILGDGKVTIILDVLGLARRAGFLVEGGKWAWDEAPAADAPAVAREEILLFRSPDEGRMAIPLSMITRLEVIPRAKLERVGDAEVVQYRDQIMPLVHVFNVLPERRKKPRVQAGAAGDDQLNVVVCQEEGRCVGLVVGGFIDTLHLPLADRRQGGREGVQATAVVRDRVTELLDVKGIIRMARPWSFEPVEERGAPPP
jgi:two-component system chemotaxis sensor kinase CheA